MTNHTAELQIFAQKYNLSLKAAIALPALFDKVSRDFKMPIRSLISDATFNNELGSYLASVATQVAEKYEAQ